MYSILDSYVIGFEVKNMKSNWKILNMKDIECNINARKEAVFKITWLVDKSVSGVRIMCEFYTFRSGEMLLRVVLASVFFKGLFRTRFCQH